jgi:uncharacterized membrane protein HdeD (DUF308 family)
MDRYIKLIKGVLLMVAFISVGVSLMVQNDIGVAAYINTEMFGLWFIVSGIVNGYIGVSNTRFNAIWFAPFFGYTAATFLAVSNGDIPLTPLIFYITLAVEILLDLFIEWGNEWRHKL